MCMDGWMDGWMDGCISAVFLDYATLEFAFSESFC